MKKEAETPVLAVISPTTFKVSPSNVRLLSHVSVFASPPTLVRIELLVAFETRGTFITEEPSDVLRFPDTTLTIKSPGRYFSAAITVPDKTLYAI
tara:strand:- start:15115 stop:15399 length:285 start_codon:yes stop_codon:yes gene_type:complete